MVKFFFLIEAIEAIDFFSRIILQAKNDEKPLFITLN